MRPQPPPPLPPPVNLTILLDAVESAGVALMPSFGNSPFPFVSTNQLGIAYIRVEFDGARKISSKQYWNHATEGWEPGPRDDAKHILKLERLAAAPDPENAIQPLSVASGDKSPLASPNVVAVVFTLDAAGVAQTVAPDALSRPYLKISSGQDY